MHWGEDTLGGNNGAGAPSLGVNGLTIAASCPTSRQPELKHAAIRIEKALLPWGLLGIAWLPEDDAMAARSALQGLMARFAFAACVPFGRERQGVLFRAADAVPVADDILLRIEALLGLAGAKVLRYKDERRGQRRAVRLSGQGEDLRIEGFLLAGDTSAEAWMRPLLQDELPAQRYGRLLLLPGANPPIPVVGRGQQVCSCFDVSATQIEAVLVDAQGDEAGRLAQLQAALRCGTNCGSCIPELKKFVRLHAVAS
jgi:assimilatory nitrate reductase catalytic subunit